MELSRISFILAIMGMELSSVMFPLIVLDGLFDLVEDFFMVFLLVSISGVLLWHFSILVLGAYIFREANEFSQLPRLQISFKLMGAAFAIAGISGMSYTFLTSSWFFDERFVTSLSLIRLIYDIRVVVEVIALTILLLVVGDKNLGKLKITGGAFLILSNFARIILTPQFGLDIVWLIELMIIIVFGLAWIGFLDIFMQWTKTQKRDNVAWSKEQLPFDL